MIYKAPKSQKERITIHI